MAATERRGQPSASPCPLKRHGRKTCNLCPCNHKPTGDKSYSGFASFNVAPNGDIYAVWLDGRDNTSAVDGNFNVYIARSTDRGATFHHNVRVAKLACPCCRPSVSIAPNGTVYVAYRHVYSDNERDIAVATSTDSGEHFSEPVRVAADRWKLFGCPESGPVTAVQGDRFVVAWYTAAGDRPGIHLTASSDGGKTFSPPLRITDAIQSANHPFLSSREDGTIGVVFSGRTAAPNGAWDELTPFAFRITPDGRVSTPMRIPTKDAGDRYSTMSLSSDGEAYIAWSEAQASGTYLARALLR